MNERALQSALADVGRDFHRRGWMLATGGNLSARLSSSPLSFLMTVSGGNKGDLGPTDFLVLDELGQPSSAEARPSAESAVHLALYRSRGPDSVLHVHSPFATLVSRRDALVGATVFEGLEFVKALGFWSPGARVEVPIVPNHHHIPTLADDVASAAGECPAVLVTGHGIYAWGASIADAARHVEAVEFLCRISWEEQRGRATGV